MSPRAVSAAGLAALAVGMGIGRFAFTPVLPLMQAEGAVSLAAGGWLATANYAGYFAGALLAPRLTPAVGVRAGLVAIVVLTLAMVLEGSVAVWIVLRALAGVASAWVLIHISAWSLERLAPLARPALSGVVYAGVGAGSMLAGALCLVVLRGRDAWLLLGLVAGLATVLLWPLFRETAKPASTPVRRPAGVASLRLVLCYAAFGFGYIIPATFLPAAARESLGDAQVYRWAWPIFGAAAAASTVAAAPFVRRFGERRVWIAGHVLMAIGIAAPLVLPGLGGILACALCVGATFMVVTMAGLQEGRKLGGTGLLAAMTAAFAAGQIAGPAFASLVLHAGGRLEYASVAACVVLIAAAVALSSRRIDR
jgi:MFS family permease